MHTFLKITLLATAFAGGLSGCGIGRQTDSASLNDEEASGIDFQALDGVLQAEVDALKAMVAELLQDAPAGGFTATKIPTKIYVLDSHPTVSGNVDASNANNGFIRIYKGLSKAELSYGLYSLGLKDNDSGLIVMPGEGTSLADVIQIRNLAAQVTAAATSSSLAPVMPASKVYVLDSSPAVNSNIDANNVANGNRFLRVAKSVTSDEFASGYFRLGLKDAASGMTFVPYDGVTFADTKAVRDASSSAITAETLALLGLTSPLKVYILDGHPTLSGNVDASNAENGFLNVSKSVTADEIKAALPPH